MRSSFLAADLITEDRREDFANAIQSARTRELVRSRTSATKAGEIRQIRKGADLLDTSSFRVPSRQEILSDLESATDASSISTVVSEPGTDHTAAYLSADGRFSDTDAHSSGLLVSQVHQSSTPEICQPRDLRFNVSAPDCEPQPAHVHAACTCLRSGNSFVTQAAHCLLQDSLELCQYCRVNDSPR